MCNKQVEELAKKQNAQRKQGMWRDLELRALDGALGEVKLSARETTKAMWKMQMEDFLREFELWGFQKGIDNQTKLSMAITMLRDFKDSRDGLGCTEGMVELFSRETSRFEDAETRVIKLPKIKFAIDY